MTLIELDAVIAGRKVVVERRPSEYQQLAAFIGRTGEPFLFRIDEGKVAEFARAVHAKSEIHSNREAARAAGLPGLLAPPTFSAASTFWAEPSSSLVAQLGLDLRRVLMGGGEWEYRSPVVDGDVFEVTSSVASVEEKSGRRGEMTIIPVCTEYRRDDEIVQTYTNQIIQFAQAKGES